MPAETSENPLSAHPTPRVTRLAPSPTGALHLGNARSFLVNWAIARRHNWKIILRIEDLDTPRIKPGSIDQTIDILQWLGMDWDEGPIIQSDDLTPFRDAMSRLSAAGLAYRCDLSRKEIEEAASAPHGQYHDTPFPPSLRPTITPREFDNPESSWRIVVPDQPISFTDDFQGQQTIDLATTIGDFVVWTKRGTPSYQLSVVVDDHRQGVTNVIRGDDLIDSAARQIHLYRSLNLEPIPHWMHLPLVKGEDGRRLAKRHGDTRLAHYREQGVRPQRVIALLARWCGLPEELWQAGELEASAFMTALDPATMPTGPVTFTQEDDRWLLSASV